MSHFFSFMLIKVIYIKRLSSFVVSPVPLLNSFNQKVTKQSYPLKKKPLVTRQLENTHKVKISTLKTTKCGKIMKLKSPSKCSPALRLKNTLTSNHVLTVTKVNPQLNVIIAH